MLYFSISWFNSLVEPKLQIPIASMIVDTLNDPFTLKNAWISFMLLSTLVPTLLHFLLALVSILLYVTKSSTWFATILEKSKINKSQKIKAAAILTFPITVLAMILLYAVVYLPLNALVKLIT